MKEKVIDILKEFVKDEEKKKSINGSTDIINEIGLDSLNMINFILKLEDTFEIELDYEDLNFTHITCVDKLCDFLNTQKAKTN
jgi:acyl carrier protein